MKQLVFTASMGASPIPFRNGTSSVLDASTTFRFTLDCTPNHTQSIGWHPLAHSHGFGLNGEPFPLSTLTVVDAIGNPVDAFTTKHAIRVYLVSSKNPRITSLHPVVPIELTTEATSQNTYEISGTPNVLYGPSWLQLQIVVDETHKFQIPLWPVGYPTYLLRGIPMLSGATYGSQPLSTPIDIIPYLSKTLNDHTYDLSHTLNTEQLLSGVDPASFFVKPQPYRAKYNAGDLHQASKIRGHLEPVVDEAQGTFYFNGSPSKYTPLTVGYDAFVTMHSTGPIMRLEGTLVKSLGSTYNSLSETWVTEIPVQVSSQALVSPNIFSNYHLSGTALNITDKATTITIQAGPTKLIRIADPNGPIRGTLALVAFNPTNPANNPLLDPISNPYNWFFYTPTQGVEGLGTLSVDTTLRVGPSSIQALPPWTDVQPTLPIYLVEFNGRMWTPYQTIEGLPMTITFDPIQLSAPSSMSTTTLQGDPLNLSGSFMPLAISGTPVNAVYIL